MTNTALLYLLLPVLSGLLLFVVLRRDRRQRVVQNRLKALSRSDDEAVSIRSLQRLRRAASRGMSVATLLPQQLRVRLDNAFEATGNRIGVMHLLITGLIASLIVNLFASRVLTLGQSIVMVLSAAAAAAAPMIVLVMAQSSYKNKFLNVFPDALDLIGRSIKAGLPVNEALVVAGQEISDPVGNELRRTLEQVQVGVPIIDALEKTADRVRVADFRFMVVALALQAKTGGSLAETLANLSRVIRARKALRLKARALSAEAKVSALVLAMLPFIIGGLMFFINHDLVVALFVDPRGRFMVGVAFVSLVTGLSIMYWMIKRATQ